MAIRVKLAEVIEGLEFQSSESHSFLNKKTGEVVLISDRHMRAAEDDEPMEDSSEWEEDLVERAKEIQETDNYIGLPTKFDIHEYSIMEQFCLSIEDAETRDVFCSLIKGSGAFRRFKTAIHEYDIADDWYTYRNSEIKQIAIDWCQQNNIEFDET